MITSVDTYILKTSLIPFLVAKFPPSSFIVSISFSGHLLTQELVETDTPGTSLINAAI